MTHSPRQAKIEYGDFQTPVELAQKVCQKLKALRITPEVVIEPTCGVGAFIEAAAQSFPSAKRIIGIDINPAYLEAIEKKKRHLPKSQRITLIQGDFFAYDWETLLKETRSTILVVGNFPWVTNSQMGAIDGVNLPTKRNFQNHTGFEALTGKSNFDISEWMLIQTAQWLQDRKGYLAMLCKTSVARKFLRHLYAKQAGLSQSSIYGIDAKKYFGASVEACLLVCEFEAQARCYDYDIYESLDSPHCHRVGHRRGIPVRDLDTFDRLSDFYGSDTLKWRSGIKHDCAEVMELREINGSYLNGLGEIAELESAYLFPMLKGSDIANNRISVTNRYMLVTQKAVGGSTAPIQAAAPKTWAYLESHASYFERRKSRIYHHSPRFSIFGIGPYTFAPYKIAIGGLYKNLDFRLVGQIQGKPTVFDDTVYFLSFNTEEEAKRILSLLTSSLAQDFYSALIFWEEKRPIKTSVLNSLNLKQFETAQPLRLL